MKFASIGHLRMEEELHQFPKAWIRNDLAISPELDVQGTKGYITGLTLTARQMLELPRDIVRKRILDAAVFLQEELGVDLIQLGAFTTSVTDGGVWVTQQREFRGYVNHGDSYTTAVACKATLTILEQLHKRPADQTLAIVGAYGVIGETMSKILVPQFRHAILIGRRKEKFVGLERSLVGDFETTTDLKTSHADVIVTATSHPTSLLQSEHLQDHAIVIDVSQPANLSPDVCKQRLDVTRIDGGIVDFPVRTVIPDMPVGKNFACIVEVIMQALENERRHHVGSIDLAHLRLTEKWGEKYGFALRELTNFGKPLRK